MDAIAQSHGPGGLLASLMRQLRELLAARGAHPARAVVLVPYAQLMPQARRAWARLVPSGFAPRFETTMNWTRSLAGFVPGLDDFVFDAARDLLTARAWLERAGLAQHGDLLAGRVMEAAGQLAGLAAAQPAAQRADWVARMRPRIVAGLEAPALRMEAAVARVALEWVAASAYPTDVLLTDAVLADVDCLVVLEGLQPEPLVDALKVHFGDRVASLPLSLSLAGGTPPGQVVLHAASGPEDEAARAAACVLRHLAAGRGPVALAATDRALTRRIRAMLGARGLRIRDETGWKLSTTRAAARLMAPLRAAAWDAGSDAVLDWLKHAPTVNAAALQRLEQALRRQGLREWTGAAQALSEDDAAGALVQQAETWRAALQPARPLAQWLQALAGQMADTGQWEALAADEAGAAAMAALRLADGAQAEWAALPQGARRMTQAAFIAWVTDVLEAASFKPRHPQDEQVVILPFAQMLGLPFAAAVLPGCDEVNLPASPEPPGAWTEGQRAALGLPGRERLEATQRAAWLHALTVPHSDVLWRRADALGESVLPSPLVQQLLLRGMAVSDADPRVARELVQAPQAMPRPVGAALPVALLSATAYEDLRRCPYRFFALRQLGLSEADELDAEVDKRDFGNWLHAVLRDFHQALASSQVQPVPPGPARQALLDQAAAAQGGGVGLDSPDFLPFAASWPQVRDGYLDWLAGHEAQGQRFVRAESDQRVALGDVTLHGRLDRVDGAADGVPFVIDYKTESLQASRDRVGDPAEDTQLAFYAALLEDDTVRAAYVNVGERETRTVEQPDVVAARDALVEGIVHDMAAIAAGAEMPALGEGRACDFCAARGLCRKDFWS